MPRRLDDLPGRNPAVISKNIEFGNSSNSYNIGIGIHLAKPGIDTIIDADICSECHGVRTDTSRARGTSREGVSRGSARTYITFNAFYTTRTYITLYLYILTCLMGAFKIRDCQKYC